MDVLSLHLAEANSARSYETNYWRANNHCSQLQTLSILSWFTKPSCHLMPHGNMNMCSGLLAERKIWNASLRRVFYTMARCLDAYLAFLCIQPDRIVNVQQAQCFRSASDILQKGRSSMPCMLSISAHSPFPAPV